MIRLLGIILSVCLWVVPAHVLHTDNAQDHVLHTDNTQDPVLHTDNAQDPVLHTDNTQDPVLHTDNAQDPVLHTDNAQDPGHYLNSFLIKADSREVAQMVAREHNFELLDEIEELKMYHLYHPDVSSRSKRSADHYVDRLKTDPRVMFAEQQITLRRVKRTHQVMHDKQLEFPLREIKDLSLFYRAPVDKIYTRDNDDLVFNDKLYKDQWYLKNYGQTGGKKNLDLNVEQAWKNGFTGRGIVITILDDGIDHAHPDLIRNYDPRASADFNDEDDELNDPTPDLSVYGNSHGTRCAGEIAAEANNGVCGIGIAYNSRIGGIRILDGRVTDRLEAKALLYKNQYTAIYSASWGPHDDGRTMEAPSKACSEALKQGAEKGRQGKGSIFVWATGNGGGYNDTCAADGYVNSIYSISMGSLSDQGEAAFYMEQCCSTMTVLPTGGEATKLEEYRDGKYKIKVVTTDINGGCTENFEGTSSAAPLGAGALALVLQANPDINWREMQHLVAMGSRLPSTDDNMIVNGAGFHVSRKFGFGMMDVGKMIMLAQEGIHLPEQHECKTAVHTVNRKTPSGSCTTIDFEFDGCHANPDCAISNVEHVSLTVKMSTYRRGNVVIYLTSPDGTECMMLSRRDIDDSNEDFEFTFMSVHHWMENPVGSWMLKVCDVTGDKPGDHDSVHVLHTWQVTMNGFSHQSDDQDKKAYTPSKESQLKWMQVELDESRRLVMKRAQERLLTSEMEQSVSKKNLEDKDYNSLISLLVNYFDRRDIDHDLVSDVLDKTAQVKGRNMKEGVKSDNKIHNFKRGYNTYVLDSLTPEVKLSKKEFEPELETPVEANHRLDSLSRDIDLLVDDLETENKVKDKRGGAGTYIDQYMARKKKLDHKKRVNDLLERAIDLLEVKRNL